MPATLLLVRHAAHALGPGVLPGRSPGVHLSAEGRVQAEALAARLSRRPLRALYSSPRERARETAEIVAARLGLAVEVRDGLDEIDYGAWTLRPLDALDGDPRWREWNERRGSSAVPGGESMRSVQARIVAEIEAIAALHDGGQAALFTHADVIKAAIASVAGVALDDIWRLDVGLGSVTVLTGGGSAPARLLDPGG